MNNLQIIHFLSLFIVVCVVVIRHEITRRATKNVTEANIPKAKQWCAATQRCIKADSYTKRPIISTRLCFLNESLALRLKP